MFDQEIPTKKMLDPYNVTFIENLMGKRQHALQYIPDTAQLNLKHKPKLLELLHGLKEKIASNLQLLSQFYLKHKMNYFSPKYSAHFSARYLRKLLNNRRFCFYSISPFYLRFLDLAEFSQDDNGNLTYLNNVTDEFKYNLLIGHFNPDSNYKFLIKFSRGSERSHFRMEVVTYFWCSAK